MLITSYLISPPIISDHSSLFAEKVEKSKKAEKPKAKATSSGGKPEAKKVGRLSLLRIYILPYPAHLNFHLGGNFLTLQSGGEKKPPPKKPAAAAKARPSSAASGRSTERVKRVFDMPGQTRDTPGEVRKQISVLSTNFASLSFFPSLLINYSILASLHLLFLCYIQEDPLRRFYTTLLEQDPDSEMARRWCAMTGLLPRNEAENWVAEQTKKKLSGKSSPMKSVPKKKSNASATAPKRKAPAPTKKKKSSTKATAENGHGNDSSSSSSSDEEEDFKSAKKAKPSFSKPKSAAAVAPSAAKNPSAKKTKKENDGEDTGSSDNNDGVEGISQPKQRSTAPPTTITAEKKTKRDVAFTDGGMDGTDSDDDVPLGQRMKTAA